MQEIFIQIVRVVGSGLQVITASPLLKFLLLAHILVGLFLAIIWIRLHPQAYFLHLIVFNSLLLAYTFLAFLPPKLILPYLAYLRFARYTQIAYHIVGLIWLGLAPSGYGFRLPGKEETKRGYGRSYLFLISASLLLTAMLLDRLGLWLPIPGFDKMLWMLPTAVIALLSLYFSSRNLIRSISEYFVFIAALALFALASYTHIFVDMTLSMIPAFMGGLLIIALILLYHRHFFQTEAELRNGLLQESQQLREKSRIQNEVLSTTSLAFVYLDAEEHVLYHNPAFAGWCEQAEKTATDTPLKTWLGKDRYQSIKTVLQEARLGKTGQKLCTWTTASGPRQVKVEIAPLFNAQRKIGHFLMTLQDMTEEDRDADRTRELLEQQEHQLWLYQTSLEAARDGVCICEPDGRIHFVNAAFSRLTGYPADDLHKRGLPVLRHPEAVPDSLRQSLQTGRSWHGFIDAVRRDGSRYPAEIDLIPLPGRDSMPALLMWIERDASAWQQQEARLHQALEQVRQERDERKETEAFYRALAESLDTGLILVRPDGACRVLNQRAGSLLGIHGDEIALKKLPPFIRDLLRFEADYGDRLQSQVAEFTDTYKQPGGRRLYLKWRVIPMAAPGGGNQILLQVEDASRHRDLEQQIQTLQEQVKEARLHDARKLEQALKSWQALLALARRGETDSEVPDLVRRFVRILQDSGLTSHALFLRQADETYLQIPKPPSRRNGRRLPETLSVDTVEALLRGASARNGISVWSQEALEKAAGDGLFPWLGEKDKALLAVPVGSADPPAAVMLATMHESPDDHLLHWLQAWSELLDQALSAIRKRQDEQRRKQFEQLLLDLDAILQEETELDASLSHLAERLYRIFPCGWLVVVDDHRTFAVWAQAKRRKIQTLLLPEAKARALLEVLRPPVRNQRPKWQPIAEAASELAALLPGRAITNFSHILLTELRRNQRRFGAMALLLPENEVHGDEAEWFSQLSKRLAGWLESRLLFEAFEQKARELERANLAISEFLANVSHDLRSPLNAVLTYVQLMQQKKELSEQEKQHYLETIYNSSDYLLKLIDNLLDFQKIESGRVEPNPAPFSPAELLKSVEAEVRPLCEQKGLRLQTRIGKNVPETLISDENLLRRLILNLANNALKFTEAGQISVSLGWQGANKVLSIQVEDTGIGIAKSKLREIFKPFYQIQPSREPNRRGLGLGLAIVQNILNLLNGRIAVESEPGKGSRFTVTIPAQPADQTMVRKAKPRSSKRRRRLLARKPRILLIDDDISIHEAMQFLLEDAGYQVEFAVDGAAAISAAQRWHPDLILLDIMMPGMDGYQVARTLKSQKRLRDIPIIALSARAMMEDQQKARDAGCEDVLTKPFDIQDLYRIMEKYLNASA